MLAYDFNALSPHACGAARTGIRHTREVRAPRAW
jgi:hypothetical protein